MNWRTRLSPPSADACQLIVVEHSSVPSRRSTSHVLKTCCRGLWLAGVVLCVFIAEAQQNGKTQPAQQQMPQQYLNTKADVQYVGDEACRSCHGSIYAEFKQTGMGRSVTVPSAEEAQEFAKPLKITNKNQMYSIYARDGKIVHEESERDAKGNTVFSEAHEIAYSVGAGDVGKSYLIAKGDSLFVSPISYYTRIRGWDLSPGYAEGIFHGFTRRVVDLCVDCHTGWPHLVPGSSTRFQKPPFKFLTVGCERCHGPGEIHVAERTQDAASSVYQEASTDLSIVNPRKLQSAVRDDVCAQCHFSGDARVLQPAKDYLDFRPGTPLGDVVAIFSVSPMIKGEHFLALGQFEQLKMSRCWAGSNGRLGCISCHDPHVQLRSDEAVVFFRERCLSCHTTRSCTAAITQRQATSPPDNCILCHMPKQPSENIGHSSITDHRILRNSSEVPATLQANASANYLDPIYDTKPPASDQMLADLRNRALAYSQLAGHFPELSTKGLEVLEQAAAALPTDAEVQAAYGLVLSVASSKEHDRAAQTLQKAIDAGSKSAEVRTYLARLRMQQDQVTAAIELYKQSIQIDPYYTAAYRELAQVYSLLKDDDQAGEMLKSVLQIDPSDEAARQALSEIRASSEKK
jgi:Tetratricopeptide repeat